MLLSAAELPFHSPPGHDTGELKFRTLSEAAPFGVWHGDASGDCQYTNARCQALLGLDAAACLGLGWQAALPPQDRVAALADWQRAAAQGVPFTLEWVLQQSVAGAAVQLRATPVCDAQGNVQSFIGVLDDQAARYQVEQALAEKHELLRVTLASIGDAVITTDTEARVVWLNPAAERLTGWLGANAQGLPLGTVFQLIDERTRAPADPGVAACLAGDETDTGLAEHRVLIARDGSEYGIEDSAAPIRSPEGRILGCVMVFHDVTEQRRLNSEIHRRARQDELTGLVNRAEFDKRLARSLARAREEDSVNTVLYIDLDQFKLVNDTCGHAVGDQLLTEVAKLLQTCVRSRDLLARLGGDEFGILLEHCPVEQAQRVAQTVCDRLEALRFEPDGRRFRVGASIGVVPMDRRWQNSSALMQAADSACDAAKRAGRHRVHVWYDTDTVLQARNGQAEWASRVAQALDEGAFQLYAQRIAPIELDADAVPAPHGLHCEILLRMCDGSGGVIAPGLFLPAAERFQMGSRLDRWVLRQVFEWMARQGAGLARVDTLAVNLSGQSVGDRAFHRYVGDLLKEIPVDASKLCFEVTETAAITSLTDATAFMRTMRRLGARTALDDFGAGAASFGYLKALPVDYLKIDGQFVRNLRSDRVDHATVCCFREVAGVVGMKTIAEFVENEEILDELRRIGIDYAQGYAIHKPQPLDDLLRTSGPIA